MAKRIDILIGSLRGGGAERVCVTVANYLTTRGFDVRLVVLNLTNQAYVKHLDKKIKIENFDIKHARYSIIHLFNYCKKEKPEVFLVFDHELAIILNVLRMFFSFKYKIVARNINTLSIKRSIEKNFWHKHIVHLLTRLFYNKSDSIIAQSEGMKQDLINNYFINPKKIVIINNPVNSQIEKVAKSLEKFPDIECDSKEILFVGRMDVQKGIQYLIDAMKICVKKDPKITLRLIGEGKLKNQIEKMCSKKEISSNVIFEGFVEDISKYYLNAKVTVLSSLYEGFPNVLIESITLGTPVVSFDCPSGPKEIIEEGVNGFLVEYLNTQDLADKILKALSYNWNKDEIRKSAKKFHPDQIIDKYIHVVEGVK